MLTSANMRRLLSLLLCLAISAVAVGQPARRPRLVLLIVADQFRYDYLTRFAPLFGKGGLRRLMRDGALWTNANFNYIPTKTAPGHSAIMTGAPPSASGIAANEWVDRQTATRVTAVGDRSAKVLGGGPREAAYSPHRLLASTVGDELRRATADRAKVIGVSDKPRAAILPAGRHANAAYWLSSSVGAAISSDYYFSDLPEWVKQFNRGQPLDKYFNARWDRMLPEPVYRKFAGADSPPWENIDEAPGDTNAFPHWVTGGATKPGTAFYDALDHSPFVNEVIVSLAESAIEHEQLGDDDVTDLLTVSLSGTDHVGHRFGPYSQEVMDVTLRADQQIERLLDFVDARVGLQNTLVVFSSDHGVSPLQDQSKALGSGGLRIRNNEVMKAIYAAIRARYPGKADDYILKYSEAGVLKDAILNGQVYFDRAALERDGIRLEEITDLAGKASLRVPGIARYFTSAQIERCRDQVLSVATRCSNDEMFQRVVRGYFPGRSGDLIIMQKPFNYLGDGDDPANHGTYYSYDTHVPVIIMGTDVKHGRYSQAATPADIAPTLSFILGIPAPNRSQGRVLREAIGSEVRSQESEVRSQESGVRSQKSEVGGQRSEVRSQKSEVGSRKSEVRGSGNEKNRAKV